VTREAEPGQTNQAGPFLTVGDVEVWPLGEHRFRVVSPDASDEVQGFEPARQWAPELRAHVSAG
jgi:hypothetical protein